MALNRSRQGDVCWAECSEETHRPRRSPLRRHQSNSHSSCLLSVLLPSMSHAPNSDGLRPGLHKVWGRIGFPPPEKERARSIF